jgi:hypothetical protein
MPDREGKRFMNWTRLALITIAAGIVTSLTDWLFAGDWLHRRYTYPEIWRQGNEAKAIAWAAPLPFLTCAVFAFVERRPLPCDKLELQFSDCSTN